MVWELNCCFLESLLLLLFFPGAPVGGEIPVERSQNNTETCFHVILPLLWSSFQIFIAYIWFCALIQYLFKLAVVYWLYSLRGCEWFSSFECAINQTQPNPRLWHAPLGLLTEVSGECALANWLCTKLQGSCWLPIHTHTHTLKTSQWNGWCNASKTHGKKSALLVSS